MELTHFLVHQALQLWNVGLFLGRNEEAVLAKLCHPRLHQFVERDVFASLWSEVVLVLLHPRVGINLIEHDDAWLVGSAEVAQCFFHYVDLFLKVGMRNIHHMNQQVCLTHFVECRFEGIHQVGWQFANEADRIAEQEWQVVDNHLAHRRVECCKQFVLCKHVALRQEVHDG